MKYQARPGIVLTQICSVYLLIPSRSAYSACRHIRSMNYFWAKTWEAILQDKPMELIAKAHHIVFGKPEEECREKIEAFIDELCRDGFLLKCPAPEPAAQPNAAQPE